MSNFNLQSSMQPSGSPVHSGDCAGRSQFFNAVSTPNDSGAIVLGAWPKAGPGYVTFRISDSSGMQEHDLELYAGGTCVRAEVLEGATVEFEVTASVDATWAAWTSGI